MKTPSHRGWTCLAFAAIVAAGWAAYAGTFSVPFIFDDDWSIASNGTIRRLWPIWRVFAPPPDAGVGGRPILNLSLALNYAWSGQQVWSYHVVNLALHVLAALTLYGLARRTFARAGVRPALAPALFGLLTALLWELHPVQTEAVTYVVGRAEVMAGLFYFLTLYGFVRYADEPARRGWAAFSILACFLGMGSKEVMVTAPVMVLLYDRTFSAGDFRTAWRRRPAYYCGLASSWLFLAGLLPGLTRRGAAVPAGISWSTHGLTNFHTLVRYLGLAFWPHPLVLDYGMAVPAAPADAGWCAALVLALLGVTVWALRRRPALGFLGAWFFIALAPTTSFIPLAGQPMAEHRLYLALAAVMAGGVLALGALASARWNGWGFRTAACAWLVLYGVLTHARNGDYRSALALWSDTVAKEPENPRAHNNLALILDQMGRPDEAREHYLTALRLNPNYTDALSNYGLSLRGQRRTTEAIRYLERAAELRPDYAEVQNNLSDALIDAGDRAGAIVHLRRALALKPDFAVAEYNLANALRDEGRTDEAISHYLRALQLDPAYPEAHNNLGVVLGNAGRVPEALAHLNEALRLRPDYADAQENLGKVLVFLGRKAEGEALLQESARLRAHPVP